MNTKHKIQIQLILLTNLLFICVHSLAQFAPTVNILEDPCGNSGLITMNTGNDILYYNGDEYMATVTDDVGVHAGISMSINRLVTYYDSFSVNQNIMDPDVAIVEVKGNVYAIATYFVNGRYYYVETYAINGGSLNRYGQATFGWSTNMGNYGTALNIDADSKGNFAIVYDDTLGALRTVTGNVAVTGTINLNSMPTPELLLPTPQNINYYPDVAIIEHSSGNYVDFTWVDQITDTLYVKQALYSALASGSPSLIDLMASLPAVTTPAYKFKYPRIACPNAASVMSKDEFTVVVEETDSSTSNKIDGFNYSAGTLTFTTYNDGNGNSPADLSPFSNIRPVVCYDNTASQVWVGWNFDNTANTFTGPAVKKAQFPIILKCDALAQIPPGALYLPVPRVLATGDYDYALSISGRNSTNNLYSFYKLNNTEDYFKFVSQSSPTLRQCSPTINAFDSFIQNVSLEMYESNAGIRENAKVFIYDLTGKKILEKMISTDQNIQFLHEFFVNNPSAIYLMRIISEKGAVLYSNKIYTLNK